MQWHYGLVMLEKRNSNKHTNMRYAVSGSPGWEADQRRFDITGPFSLRRRSSTVVCVVQVERRLGRLLKLKLATVIRPKAVKADVKVLRRISIKYWHSVEKDGIPKVDTLLWMNVHTQTLDLTFTILDALTAFWKYYFQLLIYSPAYRIEQMAPNLLNLKNTLRSLDYSISYLASVAHTTPDEFFSGLFIFDKQVFTWIKVLMTKLVGANYANKIACLISL